MEAALDIGDVDVVIVGTGISESILAAAIARTGRQVLHLEKGSTYGDNWTTIELEELIRSSELPNDLSLENNDSESTNSERIKLANRSPKSRIEVVANFGSADDANQVERLRLIVSELESISHLIVAPCIPSFSRLLWTLPRALCCATEQW